MAGKEDAPVLDLEVIVDDSLREVEERRRRYNLQRLDTYLRQLDDIERELDEFLNSRPDA